MLMACWPGQILYCVIIGNVVAFTFLLVFGFLLFLLSATGKSARSQYVWLLLAGIVLGLCNWVRSMTPIFLFSFALCLLLFTERIRQKLLRCVVFTIGASVFIVPAVVHNYRQLGLITPVMQQTGGWALATGLSLKSQGGYDRELSLRMSALAKEKYPDMQITMAKSKVCQEQALRQLRESPGPIARMIFTRKLWRFLGRWEGLYWSISNSSFKQAPWFLCLSLFHQISYFLLAVLCGWVLTVRKMESWPDRWKLMFPYMLSFLLSIGVHLLLEGSARYHFMFLPLMVMTIVCIWPPLQDKDTLVDCSEQP